MSTRGEICNDKKNDMGKIFNKFRLRKKKEADGEQAERKVKLKDNLKMSSDMKTKKDRAKYLMKKGAKSKIKWMKSKEEKEQDNKQEVEKQHKKEEKENKKKEDKKRKLKERYERENFSR